MTLELFDFQPDFSEAPKQRVTTMADVLNHAPAPALITWAERQPERSFVWNLHLDTRAERRRLLDFFSRKGGRQQAFLIPTWDNELTIAGTPASGAASIQINAASFPAATTYDDERGRYIWLADPTGGLHVSRILAATGSSPVTLTLENRLTFAPTPETLTGYAALVRFDQDELEMKITGPDTSRVEVAFRTIHHQTKKGEAFDLEPIEEVYETRPFATAEQAYGNAPFLDTMIAVALGPVTLATLQSSQFDDGWVAWVSDGGVRLIKGNRSTITRPANSSGGASGLFSTRPDTTHISLAFDQVSREVIAYQKDATTIGLRRWVSLAMNEVTFQGLSPQLFFNGVLDPAAKTAGESDVICFYFKQGDGIIYARASRDNFNTEYQFAPLCSEASRFLYLEADIADRRAVLVVIDTHWRLCTYRSTQYPVVP